MSARNTINGISRASPLVVRAKQGGKSARIPGFWLERSKRRGKREGGSARNTIDTMFKNSKPQSIWKLQPYLKSSGNRKVMSNASLKQVLVAMHALWRLWGPKLASNPTTFSTHGPQRRHPPGWWAVRTKSFTGPNTGFRSSTLTHLHHFSMRS